MWPIRDSIRVGRWEETSAKNTNKFGLFQVLLHDPSEFPEVNKKGIFIGSGQEASIAIDAEVAICVLHLKFYNQYIPIMQ